MRPDQRTLYMTDSSPTYSVSSSATGSGVATFWLSHYVCAYGLDEHTMPINRRVFGRMREYIAEGMHVDDKGRAWTADGEGMVIRSPAGKVVSAVNRQYLFADTEADANPMANFALADDKLIILPTTRLYVVQLAEEVSLRSDSAIVN